MKFKVWLVGIIITISICIRVYYRFFNPNVVLTFFDVGQGDAALIQLPFGETILIDAGGGYGQWDVGRRLLSKELRYKSISTIDIAVLTHPDQDHAMGFRGILEQFSVGELWLNPNFLKLPQPELVGQLKQWIKPTSTKLVPINLPFKTEIGRSTWTALMAKGLKSTNNRSLVFELEVYGCRILLTGDIEKTAEAQLLSLLHPVDILKVAHHGSKGASHSSFVRRVSPILSIISAGRNNHYGHPHFQTFNRLNKFGHVLRTDYHGYVELTLTPSGRVNCQSAEGACLGFTCREAVSY